MCEISPINNVHVSFFFPRINKMSSAEPIIRSKQTEKEVNGIPTQVVCTEFSNYIFVVLTQYGKIGTLISVTPDSRSNDISTPTLSTKVLLGKDEVHWMKLFQCKVLWVVHKTSVHFMLWKGRWDWGGENLFEHCISISFSHWHTVLDMAGAAHPGTLPLHCVSPSNLTGSKCKFCGICQFDSIKLEACIAFSAIRSPYPMAREPGK